LDNNAVLAIDNRKWVRFPISCCSFMR